MSPFAREHAKDFALLSDCLVIVTNFTLPKFSKGIFVIVLAAMLLLINSVQTRCIVKARLRKVHFSGDFLGVFAFLRIACSLGIPQENL